MKGFLSVFATDAINRYQTKFTVGALAGMLWDTCKSGRPMCLSHDFTRPLGWTRPQTLFLEPGLARVVGVGDLAVEDGDNEQLQQMLRDYLNTTLFGEKQKELSELRRLLDTYLATTAESLFLGGVVGLCEPGLARRVAPGIFSLEDKDHLVPLASLTPVGPGVFRRDDLLLFAHPFFRRSLSRLNTLNEGFLRALQAIPVDRMTARIALDPDLVGLASAYEDQYFEFEYWWGPKFNNDLTAIPTGMTHHAASEQERFYHSISGTQFWWQSRDGQHILEAEELRDKPTAKNDATDKASQAMYGCRYVHSIVREADDVIQHFDGSIRRYTEDEMLVRLDSSLVAAGRHTEYTKLWRLDGEIGIPEWKHLLSEYYRDNRLVGEYLGALPQNEDGVDTDSETGTSADPHTELVSLRHDGETTVQSLVPYSLFSGTGVRVTLSYRPLPIPPVPRGAFVVSEHSLVIGEDKVPVLDADVLELKKAMGRLGADLHIPADSELMTFKDLYTNFPIVHHTPADLGRCLEQTAAAVAALVTAWNKRHNGRVVRVAFGVPLEDREAIISIIGHSEDLSRWFADAASRLPITSDGLRDWVEAAATYINGSATESGTIPWTELLDDTGVLQIRRRDVDEVSCELSPTEFGLEYRLVVPKEQDTLFKLISTGEVGVAVALLVSKSTCSRCGLIYKACGCSKVLDEDVVQEIEEVRAAFPFWTDRTILGVKTMKDN